MKAILGLVLLFSFSAQADVIKCSFTEPFIDFEYSMTQSSMTVTDFISSPMGEPTKTVINNVSFQILDSGYFELWDKNKQVLVSLSLDFKGSDGMSENRYPYSAYWNTKSLHGGCSSNFLHTEHLD